MILGTISQYGKKYQHIETNRLVSVINDNAQMKFGAENPFHEGPARWTTAVIYQPDDCDHWFITDVDSFRRKFKEVEEVKE
jgi:hypothetical protein